MAECSEHAAGGDHKNRREREVRAPVTCSLHSEIRTKLKTTSNSREFTAAYTLGSDKCSIAGSFSSFLWCNVVFTTPQGAAPRGREGAQRGFHPVKLKSTHI